jgi:hypothetical protein
MAETAEDPRRNAEHRRALELLDASPVAAPRRSCSRTGSRGPSEGMASAFSSALKHFVGRTLPHPRRRSIPSRCARSRQTFPRTFKELSQARRFLGFTRRSKAGFATEFHDGEAAQRAVAFELCLAKKLIQGLIVGKSGVLEGVSTHVGGSSNPL